MANEEDGYKPIPEYVKTWETTVPAETGAKLSYGDMHQIMHRDISIGNDFRKERIKHLITMATGVFALTITFQKDMFGGLPSGNSLLILCAGWGCLIGSLGAGVRHLERWEEFYISHRESVSALWNYHVQSDDSKKQEQESKWHGAIKKTAKYQKGYRTWNRAQTWLLILGLILLVVAVGMSFIDRGGPSSAEKLPDKAETAGTGKTDMLHRTHSFTGSFNNAEGFSS